MQKQRGDTPRCINSNSVSAPTLHSHDLARRATTTADAIIGGRIAIGFERRRDLSELERLAGFAVLSAGEEARRDHTVKAFGEQHAVGRLVEDLRAWV